MAYPSHGPHWFPVQESIAGAQDFLSTTQHPALLPRRHIRTFLLPPPPLSPAPPCISTPFSPKHDDVSGGPDLPIHDPCFQAMVREAALGVGQDVGRAAAVQDRRVADEASDGERGVHELVDDALLENLLDARPASKRARRQTVSLMSPLP